jgi:hypothetical protein
LRQNEHDDGAGATALAVAMPVAASTYANATGGDVRSCDLTRMVENDSYSMFCSRDSDKSFTTGGGGP